MRRQPLRGRPCGCGLGRVGVRRVLAEEGAPALFLDLELNMVQPSQAGCRTTFVITNRLGGDLDRVTFEIALFGKNGAVERMSALDFRDLPEGKTKVSRFDIPGTDCAGLGHILVNAVPVCEGVGIGKSACLDRLKLVSRAEATLGM